MSSFQFGPLAQLVEHLTFNQVVEGSNPSGPTKLSAGFRGCGKQENLFGYTPGIPQKAGEKLLAA
jgi:hypothetical protein